MLCVHQIKKGHGWRWLRWAATHRWRLRLPALLLLFSLFWPSASLLAQSSPTYWRYEAFGQLDLLAVADINYDGMDEFVVVAESVSLSLVRSDGSEAWSYRAQSTILQLAAVNVDGDTHPQGEIAFTTATQLILLGSDGGVIWEQALVVKPVALMAFRMGQNGQEQLLLLGSNGRLLLYDGLGNVTWEYTVDEAVADDTAPRMMVDDVNRDGQNEVALGYFLARGFSQLTLIGADGQEVWKRSLSGRITALTFVRFDADSAPYVAVGTLLQPDRTFVYVYDALEGREQWYRTPTKTVTALVTAQLPGGPALLVGTSVGTVIAYDAQGKRYWTRIYADQANRRIAAIAALTIGTPETAEEGLPVGDPSSGSLLQRLSLAVTLAPEPGSAAADVLLLNGDGRLLETFPSANASGLTRLTDINHDNKGELLLARFAALELLDPGIGTQQNLPGWNYSLDAQPQAALVADIDRDGQEELLIGANDGRLHILSSQSTSGDPGSRIENLGGVITHIALAETGLDGPPDIVVVRNTIVTDDDQRERLEGGIMVLRPDGRLIWQTTLPTIISSVLAADINNSRRTEIIVGTNDGQVITYSLAGEEFWRVAVNGSVEHLAVLDGQRLGRIEIVAATSAGELYKINNKGTVVSQEVAYLADITSLWRIDQTGELQAQLLLTVDDGTVRGLNWRGIELPNWVRRTDGLPTLTIPAGNSFLIATDEAHLLRLDFDNNLVWQLSDLGLVKSLYWGDLDGDVRPDIAVGNRDGDLLLFTGDGSGPWDTLSLGSGVYFVGALRNADAEQMELVVVNDNGEVHQFRSQVNRPPLIVNPQTEAEAGQYSVNVSVQDVENDLVRVQLEVYDAESGNWTGQGVRTVNGVGTMFWSIDPQLAANGLLYRFSYADASQTGVVGPLPGIPAIPPDNTPNWLGAGILLAAVAMSTSFIWLRYNRSLPRHAHRCYRQLKQRPSQTLDLLAAQYNRRKGSPDFLLNLGNQARQDNNRLVASLADGLFLLADRPEAALTIINTALDEVAALKLPWENLEMWQQNCRQGLALLEAPTITESSLLRPQLMQLLEMQTNGTETLPAMAALLPILTALRDSERVDLADDRLVYLHEARVLIRQLQEQLADWPARITTLIVGAIATRWDGLVSAAIEELRGQAQIAVTLKTRRLAPQPSGIVVALEVGNFGRAAAENITLRLAEDPAYESQNGPIHIPILPPGRTRQVEVGIRPRVEDRFRAVFQVTYDDRHQQGKTMAFGDMVHLLSPARQFTPIANPYLPGTPLRRHSALFYGREDLFQFIAENAARRTQRNVLILMGQRRTGKTSALLRLEEYLPPHVLPVYIDCQSLGVTPGMPAFFHDLAWLISDALAARGIDLPVPEPEAWLAHPTRLFERQFLPAARAAAPPDAVFLFVFDEFEAFENLVNDDILPPTLFTYLRHMMQHGEGVGFVFAGTRRLEEMTTDYWSVLFNIALYRQIDFLDRDAAIRLITEPVAPNLIYDDLALDKILRVTAGHPYFLQLVCYTLVNRANSEGSGYVTINDVNAGLDEMLRLGEVHFAYIWQRSTPNERALLTAVAHLMDRDLPFRPADLQQYLADYGIHLTPAEVTAGLTHLVERDIMREFSSEATTLYELKIGLVGLWTAQNKSLSKLLEEKAFRAPLS
ncbi:MAG: hypothetical protein Fur0021_08790 [Candidatus Promineifilaceae bacterium]